MCWEHDYHTHGVFSSLLARLGLLTLSQRGTQWPLHIQANGLLGDQP
jgi:hypothetical protein